MHRIQVTHILKPTPTLYIQNESDQCQAFNIPWGAWGGMYGMSVFNQHLYLKFDLFVLWGTITFSGKSGFEQASWIVFLKSYKLTKLDLPVK